MHMYLYLILEMVLFKLSFVVVKYNVGVLDSPG